MLRRRVYLAIAAPLIAVGLLFYGFTHKAEPYFAEIPQSELRQWELAPYLPEGDGADWSLHQYREPEPAGISDEIHFVLQRDGKAYDLINSRDTWGFAGAVSWQFDLIDHKFYVFDAHQQYPAGWFHIEVKPHDRWLLLLGMAPDGNIRTIKPVSGVSMPPNPSRSGIYEVRDGRLQFVRTAKGEDDLFEHLQTGDYYLASPGAGVAKVLDLDSPALFR